jgi:biotin-dependent carboxylase-like uncharacterized protein
MTTRWLEVRRTGLATSVQDLGRPGLADLGVTASGAVDRAALRLANRLVGNPEGAAALETSGGLVLRASAAVLVAIAGADAPLTIDGRPGAGRSPTVLPGGGELVVGPPRTGLRTYVAVRGGIDVAPVLGSRSWDSLGRLGPAPPEEGQHLPVGPDPRTPVPVDVAPPRQALGVARLWVGPRLDWFDPAAARRLVEATWWVRSDSDRIGVRLDGPVLTRSRASELPTEGLVPGAVQVPPDGRPIVMSADHPTTGGYPVIAVVDPEDLAVVTQAAPGQSIRFRWAEPAVTRR